MSTELSRTSGTAGAVDWYNPRSIADARDLAKIIHASGLAPKGYASPEAIFVGMTIGAEHGFSVIRSLNLISVVEGRPSLNADTMVALVLSSGCCERWDIIESNEATCTVETLRRGATNPVRVTWTWARASKILVWMKSEKKPLTTKDTWQNYPSAMLHHRACAELARKVYPDIIAGLYTRDEIESDRDESEPQRITAIASAFSALPQQTPMAPAQLAAESATIEATRDGQRQPATVERDNTPEPKTAAATEMTEEQRTLANAVREHLRAARVTKSELAAAVTNLRPEDVTDLLADVASAAAVEPDEERARRMARIIGDILLVGAK